MKVIGLIGGMSRESSLEYYRIINETVNEKLWNLHSAKVLLFSVDFEEIERLQHQGEREKLTEIMIEAGKRLERWGAEMLLICTNTMHKMADDVAKNVGIPLLHIADATAEKIKEKKYQKIWLLGTKFTMEQEFYKGRLQDKYGLEIITPSEADRNRVHTIIYDELCKWILTPESKTTYLRIIETLVHNGAEAVILWCTEISLLVQQGDISIPLFDTTRIHAESAVIEALK